VKLDEENPTYGSLAQENGFGSSQPGTFAVAGTGTAALCRKECNKYGLRVNCC